jgi:hypothetical protein
MRRLLTALVLLVAGSLPAAVHDWFTGSRDPVRGHSCCGVSDCFELDPEDVQPTGDGGFRFRHPHTGNVWHTIAANRVQPSRTGRYAGCVWGGNSEAGWKTCGFAPSMF